MKQAISEFALRYGGPLRHLPDSLLFGGSFARSQALEDACAKSNDPRAFVDDYRKSTLAAILRFAKENAAFYAPFTGELANFPLIDKSTIQANFDSFRARNAPPFDYVTTGGTSGKPFGFYINKERKGAEWYFMTSQWARVGFDRRRSWRAVMRNYVLRSGEPYRKYSFLREIAFPNYDLTPDRLSKIVDTIIEFQPEFIHAYPSAGYALGRHIAETGRRLPSVKAFLCGSENVFHHQRELLEGSLGIRMYTWYGHSEKLVLAGECEASKVYHANPFYGHMELIDEAGHPVSKPGQRGEIVGTGYINTAMPFIRYKTGDSAEYVGEQCPNCGRIGTMFTNVVGRWSGERVIGASGEFVTTTALNMHSAVYDRIRNLQYYQDTPGVLEVHVVPDVGFSSKDEKAIHEALAQKLGSGFTVVVKTTTSITFTAQGKYKLLIQKLPGEREGAQ